MRLRLNRINGGIAMASEKKAAPAVEAPFANLLASKPPSSAGGTLAATFVSLVVHTAVLGALGWATQALAEEITQDDDEETVIALPPELELPPPPPPPDQPQPQVQNQDIPRGFQTLAVPDIVPTDIPPPNPTQVFREQDFLGVGVRGGVGDGEVSETGEAVVPLSEAPRFVPMTVRPQILNTEDVVRALERNYPPLLRDAGIGGETTVWFFIDVDGKVLKTQIDTPSGYDALDQAALKVAEIIKFSPAQNRDKKVQVWVSLPIKFSTR
jgi:protein TonB